MKNDGITRGSNNADANCITGSTTGIVSVSSFLSNLIYFWCIFCDSHQTLKQLTNANLKWPVCLEMKNID